MQSPTLIVVGLVLLSSCSNPSRTDAGGGDGGEMDVSEDIIVDAGPQDSGPIGPMGGTVDHFRFAAFGDVRPPTENDVAHYPTAIIGEVIGGIAEANVQFAIGTGDYMFVSNGGADVLAGQQLDLLRTAEQRFNGYVFHALGNHECNTGTSSNCPNGSETINVRAFRERLQADLPAIYFDWTVRTAMGDAHFIATAPNAWSSSQAAWLDRVLAIPATYTFVIAHETPTDDRAPGSMAIEDAVRMRATPVTLRLYGHLHTYRHIEANAIVVGNAGAPLSTAASRYGFTVVEQRADGNVVITAYTVGHPAMVEDTFVLRPDGTITQ